MSDGNIVVRRVSARQLDILWEYLSYNKDIATAYNRSLQAKEYSKRKWLEITEILNSQGEGAHKDWRGWSKYWVDYKAKLKKRAAAVRFSLTRTGGRPSIDHPLTDIERKYLQILGEDFGQGLPGVQVEPFLEHTGSIAALVEVLETPGSDSILNQPTPVPLLLEPGEAPFQQPEVPFQHPNSHKQPARTPPTPQYPHTIYCCSSSSSSNCYCRIS